MEDGTVWVFSFDLLQTVNFPTYQQQHMTMWTSYVDFLNYISDNYLYLSSHLIYMKIL